MAKFKVGDKVKVKGAGVETIKAVYPKGKGSGLDSTQVDMSVDWYETDGGGMIADEDIVGVANSRACNAKFKPGNLAYIKKTGEVCKVLAEMPRQAGKTVYKIKIIEGPYRGEEEGLFESDLLSESEHLRSLGKNSLRSRNASAKIVTTGNFGTLKVGDRVDFRKSRYWRGTGVVTKVYGDGIIDVKGDNGEGEMEIHEEDIMNSRVRSTNAVVQKALNACARNGGIDDFKVGDRVMVRSVVGFTPTDPKPGTVTAIYKSDNRIAVKKDDGGRGLFDASMVTKNACGTASNATDADVARYLSAAKDRIRGEVSTLKDVVGLLKMKPIPPSAEKAHEKIVKAMASLQRALAELS